MVGLSPNWRLILIITGFLYLANGANAGFPKSIVFGSRPTRVLGKGYSILINPQYERGAHRCGWKDKV